MSELSIILLTVFIPLLLGGIGVVIWYMFKQLITKVENIGIEVGNMTTQIALHNKEILDSRDTQTVINAKIMSMQDHINEIDIRCAKCK